MDYKSFLLANILIGNKKNCGVLQPLYAYNEHRARWQIQYEDGYHRNIVYV